MTTDLHLCRRLVARADSMRQQDPERAVILADAARSLASALDRRCVARGPWRALQAEAWGATSSALRARGESDVAEGALNVALAMVGAEARAFDPTLPPRLAQRAAYLRADQERYTEALELITEATRTFAQLGRRRLLATAMVDRAVILGTAGRKRAAVRALRISLEHHGSAMDRRTRLAAVHNTAVFLHETARTPTERREALRWLRLAIRCHDHLPAKAERHKLRALLGLSSLDLGLVDQGFEALWTAFLAFRRIGALHQQASILLDLARAALLHERPNDLLRISGEMFSLRRGFTHDRPIERALRRLHRALQDGGLTPRLVANTAEAMRARPGS